MTKKEERHEKINELLKQAEEGIKNVFESEAFINYLTTMSKFHNYSYRNSILIQAQNPTATHVAGFAAWKTKFNRQVQKGEKGIQIIGYTPREIVVSQELNDEKGNTVLDKEGNPIINLVKKNVPDYTPVYVFDVSQTEGEPLPKLMNELDGSVEDYNLLMRAIADISPFSISYEEIKGEVKGYCDPGESRIAIKKGMSETQSIKTAIHEVTHAVLHVPEDSILNAIPKDSQTQEIEAESTAFVVCSHYGIDTSDYSFPYLAAWSQDKELKVLQNSLETIQKQSSKLIDKLDKCLFELHKEREKELFYEISPEQVNKLVESYEKKTDRPRMKEPEVNSDDKRIIMFRKPKSR